MKTILKGLVWLSSPWLLLSLCVICYLKFFCLELVSQIPMTCIWFFSHYSWDSVCNFIIGILSWRHNFKPGSPISNLVFLGFKSFNLICKLISSVNWSCLQGLSNLEKLWICKISEFFKGRLLERRERNNFSHLGVNWLEGFLLRLSVYATAYPHRIGAFSRLTVVINSVHGFP